MVVSLANPTRSAQGGSVIPVLSVLSRRSGGIRRRHCGRGKLRRDVAVKDRRADMIEAALQVGPDFAADIGPAFAEGEILAQIGSGLMVDHALEQAKPVRTSGQRIERMLAEK